MGVCGRRAGVRCRRAHSKIKEGEAVPEPKIQCLQRDLQCPTIEKENRVLKQSLRLKLHRRSPPNDESPRISNDTEHPVPFGTTYHGCFLLQEFDRRTAWPAAPVPPGQTGKEDIDLVQLKRFARHGGPNLYHLRAVSSIQISQAAF